MLTMQRVCAIVAEFGMRGVPGPLGVTLPYMVGSVWYQKDRHCRIESGSGIAGRSKAWRIVDIRSGDSTESVTTAKELRRLLREWCVGTQKPTHPGSTFYARHVHEANGQEWRWCQVVNHSQSTSEAKS